MLFFILILSVFFHTIITTICIYILYKYKKNNTYISYFIFILTSTFISIARLGFMLLSQPNLKLLCSILIQLWPLIILSEIFFIFNYTKKIRLSIFKIITAIFTLLAGFIIFLQIQVIFFQYEQTHILNFINNNRNLNLISIHYNVLVSSLGLIVLFVSYFSTTNKNKKHEIRLLLIGVTIPIISSMFFEGILPQINLPYFRDFNIVFLVIAIIILSYAMNHKYLLKINPILGVEDIFNIMPDMIILAKKNFEIIEVNPQVTQLTNYTKSELYKMNLFDLLKDDETYQDNIEYVLISNGLNELKITTKDGNKIPVSISISEIFQPKTKVIIGYLIYLQNISNRLKLEKNNQELQSQVYQIQKMEAIGQLAGGVSHDFNNMLGAISILAEDIYDEYANTDPYLNGAITTILSSVNQAKDLINNLLGFARKGKLEMRQISMHNEIDVICNILERTLPKNIKIKKDLRALEDTILGDTSQIQNAILNIAINARDAMREGGNMTFKTSTAMCDQLNLPDNCKQGDKKHYFCLEITDVGTGISEEIKEKIFEPFFTTKKGRGGTGLGLSGVFGTIKNHDGYINVDTEIGKGTTFKLIFPLEMKIENDIDEIDSSSIPLNFSRKYNVLVIDDEDSIRSACKMILTKIGMKIKAYEDPIKAIKYYKNNYHEIDVILLDLIMPSLSGYECFMELKKINPNLKVIIMTGFAEDGEITKLMNAGAQSFLLKPFKKENLINCLNKI